ncbi:MAG: CoA transferase, partial [Chloroflexi bacterium]
MAKPLEGIRVLDLCRYLAGPFCCLLLAGMGAEVIKIDRPGGEPDRMLGPFAPNGQNFGTLSLARNKKSITLNLRSARGMEIFRGLVKRSDIVTDSFSPTAKQALGLDYPTIREINPAIIAASISGFGQYGPYSERRCFDPIAQAMSGAMSMCGFPGDPPTRCQVPYVDFSTGLYAALGILLALRHREKTGRGQEVDISLMDTALSFTAHALAEYKLLGEKYEQIGNHSRYNASDLFRAKDGWVFISLVSNPLWQRFLQATGMEELQSDPRFSDDLARYQNRDVLDPIIGGWVAQRTVKEAMDILEKVGVPCGPVKAVTELLDDPHVQARETVVDVDCPQIGKVPLFGMAIKLSETPGDLKTPAPLLGEHNEEVYCGLLGFGREELAELEREKVI